ncbi:hypothetical protein ABZS94_28765 [Streptomyces sp. NPDC005500]|uniref:hypothetical protein n=1 Tax=Streptomyces sp. NPDC005500 TaxID=3155007 RepID=UPI0033B98C80
MPKSSPARLASTVAVPWEAGLCPDCEQTRLEEAQQSVAAEDMAGTNGILARRALPDPAGDLLEALSAG